jgi:hypothetical protein
VTLLFHDVMEDPDHARRVLQDDLYGVNIDRHLVPRTGGLVLDITFAALPELASAGYPDERARISIWPNTDIYAYPLGSERTWHHRYPSPLGPRFGYLAGQLCLWYPRDPRHLRWEWPDGLEQYVTRVHRHLHFEEYFRREDHWPVEDAPHDEPIDGAHPIATEFMRQQEHRWAS